MPAPNEPELTALWVVDPTEAGRIVRAALRDAEGNRAHAAKELGVSLATLKRWLRRYSQLRGA